MHANKGYVRAVFTPNIANVLSSIITLLTNKKNHTYIKPRAWPTYQNKSDIGQNSVDKFLRNITINMKKRQQNEKVQIQVTITTI